MNFDDVLPSFIAEASELLREMEAGLLECARGQASAETINLIFRTAHTIKGSAGLFGLDAIVSFVHGVETLLDRVRLDEVTLDARLVQLLLDCRDHIAALVACAADAKNGVAPELMARSSELLGELGKRGGAQARRGAERRSPQSPGGSARGSDQASESSEGAAAHGVGRAGGGAAPGVHVSGAPGSEAGAVLGAEAGGVPGAEPGGTSSGGGVRGWRVRVQFSPDVLMSGMDPIAFIRYLTTFGTISQLQVLDDALPPLSQIDVHRCYLGFDLTLETTEDRAKVEGAFEFVRDDCTLFIDPVFAPAAGEAPAEVAMTSSNTATSAGAAKARSGAAKAPSKAAKAAGETARAPADPDRAPAFPRATTAVAPDLSTLRVDAQKLDTLITRIGELIIAAAGANMAARKAGNTEVEESLSVLTSLVEEVRGGALQLRMVKIGATFSRFGRVVHDVARDLGKEIKLVVSGEDTELDKTLVERITDPLTHLVRNAIDHGIEPADVRVARGKPVAGTVRLNAFHDSGSIVIEVSDDGGGLRREKILAKAIERGLADPDRVLSDAEIFGLIFEPGFSTAEKVTNLSGRGVGMDVVKRNITAMRGDVGVRSTEGVGTTVTVRLPLTLAIINGFQVGLGESVFVLPLESIEECVEFSAEDGRELTSLRGEVLPFIKLRDLFQIKGSPARRQSIVVVGHAGQRAGLVVDALHGESQTVIKPLGKMFRQVECVSGSSILGTGEVALILDVAVLVQQAVAREQRSAMRDAPRRLIA